MWTGRISSPSSPYRPQVAASQEACCTRTSPAGLRGNRRCRGSTRRPAAAEFPLPADGPPSKGTSGGSPGRTRPCESSAAICCSPPPFHFREFFVCASATSFPETRFCRKTPRRPPLWRHRARSRRSWQRGPPSWPQLRPEGTPLWRVSWRHQNRRTASLREGKRRPAPRLVTSQFVPAPPRRFGRRGWASRVFRRGRGTGAASLWRHSERRAAGAPWRPPASASSPPGTAGWKIFV